MSNKNAYLKEMGIDIWRERTVSVIEVNDNTEVLLEPTSEIRAPSLSIKKIEAEKVNIDTLDWDKLTQHILTCQLCPLSQTRTHSTVGVGHKTSALMIVAEEGNEQSEKLLTAMLKAIGLQRNDVYITNVIKCAAAETAPTSDEHILSCEPYLLREINLIKPKLILALGNAAAHHLLKNKSTMNRLRGQLHFVENISSPVLVSYHPTYLLAAPREKRKAWDDLQLALKEINA